MTTAIIVIGMFGLAFGCVSSLWLMMSWKQEAISQRNEKGIALLKSDRLVDALKSIALSDGRDAIQKADTALRDYGLKPWIVTADCPEDRVYLMPKGWVGKPTDYF